jgi:very-short-patch-repair endonuclease
MSHTHNCLQCNKSFSSNTKHSKYCSHGCFSKTQIGKNKTGTDKICLTCGKSFYVQKHRTTTKYCSNRCSGRPKSPQSKYIECSNEFCKNMFWRTPSDQRDSLSGKYFCSVKCANIYRSQLASEKRKYTSTKPELLFGDILKELNEDYCVQFWVNWKKGWKKFYDFYLPKYDLLVEVDGTYWHGKNLKYEQLNKQQIKTRDNDEIKNELAKFHNFKLWRIWSDELDLESIKEYLKNVK